MFLKQVVNKNLALCSYMVADEKTHEALVVDPGPDIDVFLTLARENKFEIKYVILTHFPSEYQAGHLQLSGKTKAQIAISSTAKTKYKFYPLGDDDSLEFGDLLVKVAHTPGHTEESICLLLFDVKTSTESPQAVLTGDTLLCDECGRPDLLATEGHSSEHLAGLLYDSIQLKLSHLPGETKVYPGHIYDASDHDKPYVRTMEEERHNNYIFHAANRDDFVEMMTAYTCINEAAGPMLAVNKGSNIKAREGGPKALTIDEILEETREGALVIDFRSIQQYAGRHLRGSINIPAFANLTLLADLVERPAIIVANPGEEGKAIDVLRKAKFDSVLGFLNYGMGSAGLLPKYTSYLERIPVRQLLSEMESEKPPLLIDVRPQSEWKHDGFLGSANVPFSEFSHEAEVLERGRRTVLYCETEFHSGIAASVLQHRGYENVATLLGGMNAWKRLKVELGPDATFATTHK